MKQVTIGIACDGVSIYLNDKRYWLDEEGGSPLTLEKLFKDLGYQVEFKEEY